MDVTKENFIQLLPEISETIKNCDFIAIDTELSGLMRERSSNRFDLPEDKFSKTFVSSRGYFIMQFGISCFSLTGHRHYDNRTYNFYIFPQSNESGFGDIDRTFSLQAHAIQFLTKHNFDFNKLFKHGVSYLTYQEKQDLTAKLKSGIDPTNKDKLKGDQQKQDEQQLQQLPKLSPEEEKERQKEALIVAKGFLEVLELVILFKKPLVGHNLFLDLIQIINQFIVPLDNDYSVFKETCHSLFSIIYDTKYIAHTILEASTLTNNQSRLNDLYCQLKDSELFPKIKVKFMNDVPNTSQLPHQAGYDAFMSGYCFVVLCESYVEEKRKYKFIKKDDSASESKQVSIAQDNLVVKKFANRIYLSYSYDFKFFNLAGDEEEPNRDHLFYVTHPNNWSHENLFQLFYKQGGVIVSRIDRASSMCALRDVKHLGSALILAKESADKNKAYKIYTYEKYLEDFKSK